MPATAADLPPELVNKVMRALVAKFYLRIIGRQEKHVRGLASLTCRYFSEILRPTIYKTIVLKSRDDLLTLISFLDLPVSRIKDYIHYIHVTQYEPCEPWLHLLHTSLMYRLPRAKIQHLSLATKESSPTAVTLRSIHKGPPTSIPPACWHIEELRLNNLLLNSFDHLVKLIAGLPHLSRLRCERLVWPSVPPDTLPAFHRYNRRKQRWGFNVTMKDCAEPWPIFWFHPGISQIERRDVLIMGRLIRCMANWLFDSEMESLSISVSMSSGTCFMIYNLLAS